VVAPENLEVSPADAGQVDPYENLAGAWFGPGQFFDCRLSVKKESKHRSYQLSAKNAAG
jgi:ferredoxin-NADP reductase